VSIVGGGFDNWLGLAPATLGHELEGLPRVKQRIAWWGAFQVAD
jgi:hypothetical protein